VRAIGIVVLLLAHMKVGVIRIVVLTELTPGPSGAVCGRVGGRYGSVGVELQAGQLGKSIALPSFGQLGFLGEAAAVVIGGSGQCLHCFVEVGVGLAAVLKGAGLVFACPVFALAFSLRAQASDSRRSDQRCVMRPPAIPAVSVPATPMPATTTGTYRGVELIVE
jgi:hypothetical protein